MLRRFALWMATSVVGLFALAACSTATRVASSSESSASTAPVVVARYADTTLTLSQFERRYADANGGREAARDDSVGAYRDFLDRVLGFRLKVHAARAAGMDTLPSIRQDVRAYRQQVAPSALQRKEIMDPLIRTLYERQKEEVDVSHILVRVDPDAPPADTLAAYRKTNALRDSVLRGMPFAVVAEQYSDDPSAQQQGRPGYQGRLGYVTAGQLVGPFEDRMYSVSEGSISDVFRTRFGFHILNVHDRRPREHPVQLSHLMIRPDSASAADTAAARRLIDSLHTALAQGADFAPLATEYSDDPRSAPNGGDLGFVRPGSNMPDAFATAIDSLQARGVGSLSDVFQTRFGFHVLKMTDRQEPPSYEEAYDDLKEQVGQLPRVEKQETALARSLRDDIGTTVDTARVYAALATASLDSTTRMLLSLDAEGEAVATPFATMGDSTYTLGMLRRHALQHRADARTLGAAMDGFLNKKALAYAAARLERRDSSFARMMREYREGLLLFRYMQDSVWTVAQQDTAGLRARYAAHPERYRFPPRVRTLVLRSPVDSLLQPYADAYAADTPLSTVTARAAADSLVEVDTVLVSPTADDPYAAVQSVPDGTAIGPRTDTDLEPFWLVRESEQPARPQTFEEARSAVLRDHQDAFEAQVVKRLRRRFNAETHPNRLRLAFQNENAQHETTAASDEP